MTSIANGLAKSLMNSQLPRSTNVSSWRSANRHMKSSFSLRRFGVIRRMSRPRWSVWVGGSKVGSWSLIGSESRCSAMRSEMSPSAYSSRGTGNPGNGPVTAVHDEKVAVSLKHGRRLLVPRDHHHVLVWLAPHRALAAQRFVVRVRVGDHLIVAEEVDGVDVGHRGFLSRIGAVGCIGGCNRVGTTIAGSPPGETRSLGDGEYPSHRSLSIPDPSPLRSSPPPIDRPSPIIVCVGISEARVSEILTQTWMWRAPAVSQLRQRYQVWTPAVLPMTERWFRVWQSSGLDAERAVRAAAASSLAIIGVTAEEGRFDQMELPARAQLDELPTASIAFLRRRDGDAEFELVVRSEFGSFRPRPRTNRDPGSVRFGPDPERTGILVQDSSSMNSNAGISRRDLMRCTNVAASQPSTTR